MPSLGYRAGGAFEHAASTTASSTAVTIPRTRLRSLTTLTVARERATLARLMSKETRNRARFQEAIANVRSRSAARSKRGEADMHALVAEGNKDALLFLCDWCIETGRLAWAEQWAELALKAGEYAPLVETAYAWIYGKDGWQRAMLRGPMTRGRDPRRGLRILTRAARRGEIGAIYYLSQIHEDGGFLGSNDALALRWTRRGAALGDEDCITNLGLRYFYGKGVRRDRQRALALYRRAAAIGSAYASYNIGLHYEHGDVVPRNERTAARWMRRAGELGNPSGWLRLADYCFDGRGVRRSARRGLAYLRRAQRETWRGDREIARRKLWGEGLALDVKGGLSILRERIRRRDAEAMWILATWYHDAKEDYARATRLYRRGAELGDVDSMCSLHDCLSGGHGSVRKDDRAALRWLRRALALDDDGACYRMGERLVEGRGVRRDARKGLRLIQRSIDARIGNASQAMGDIILERARTRGQARAALEHFLEARRLGVDDVDARIRECRKRLRNRAR